MFQFRHILILSVILAAVLGPAAAAPAAKKAEPTEELDMSALMRNWNLRDRYILELGKAKLDYAVETSEWRLRIEGVGTLADYVSFKIELADGRILDAAALGKADTNRETKPGDFGNYTKYWTDYPEKDGIKVRHSITTHTRQPFYTIEVEIGNAGGGPVEIAEIEPVVLGPGGIAHSGPGAVVHTRRYVLRGMCAQYDPAAQSMLTIFDNPQAGYCVSLGVFPGGAAVSSAQLIESGGCWRGGVRCVFNPPVRLDPGSKIVSDEACLTIATDAADVDLSYGWVMSKRLAAAPDSIPASWITVAAGASEADLMSAAGNWGGAAVRHALVPAGWEGRPGSLEGGMPRFPQNIARVAQGLRKAGFKAGLTVDGMLAGSNGDATSSDGRQWFNLVSAGGMKKAVDHYKKVSGFDFYAVQPSAVPDEVLKAFNMTRAQADTLAMTALREAHPGKPVLSTAGTAIKLAAEEGRAASAAVAKMAYYGACIGPIQLPGDSKDMSEDAIAAIAAYPGPFELVGNGGAGKNLKEILGRHRVGAPRPSSGAEPKNH